MNNWLLKGLDGGNPLAFLAAIGTLRTVTAIWPQARPRMSWQIAEGAWRPSLTLDGNMSDTELAAGISSRLEDMRENRAFTFSDNLSVLFDDFRKEAITAMNAGSSIDRRHCDFIAAFGNEVVEGDKAGQIADTALRTMSGAGHQHFLGFMRQLAIDTQDIHIQKALFSPWRYDDPLEKHTMRWDPRDDVRRALRWNEPSGDPARKIQGSVWGANRLAIEGLSLLPTAPVGSRLETTGFVWRKGEGIFWSWPIWEGKLTMDVVRSLLALDELRKERPDRSLLAKMGIREIYRTQRITQGRYRNFSPAMTV